MKKKLITIAISCVLIAFCFVVDGLLDLGVLTSSVEARRGRPLTPASVAGVARRTTRRRIRRTAVVVATLPKGYTTVVVEGTTLYKSGSTYYQASGGQYTVVEVD